MPAEPSLVFEREGLNNCPPYEWYNKYIFHTFRLEVLSPPQ